jgi:ABC-2 type transport system permease protein
MFKEILLFELKYRFTRPATYLYFLIFFLFSFMGVVSDSINIGATSEKIFKNAPVVIASYTGFLSVLGIFIASAIMGVPVFRDIEHKTNTYFFALPISEKSYLLGRFLGSFLTLAFVFLSINFGILLGSLLAPILGLVPAEKFGDFNFMHYLMPYITIALPNLFFSGTIFFVVVALTRYVLAAYLGSVVMIMLYIFTSTLTKDLDNKNVGILLDIFGIAGLTDISRYWTVAEQNTQTVALSGFFLYNRLLWVGISLVFLGGLLLRFSFQNFLATATISKKKVGEIEEKAGFKSLAALPKVQQVFSFGLDFRKMFSFATLEFQQAIKNPFFLAMAASAFLLLVSSCWRGDAIMGTPSLPLTYIMLEAKKNNFLFLFALIIIFYTGEMVFKDRVLRFSPISDAFPVPNWLLYGSKLIGMVYICLFLIFLPFFAGILVQTIKGYFTYELDVYFIDLFIYTLPFYLQLAALSFFIQIAVNNKFVGYFAVALVWIILSGLQMANYNFNMYLFGNTPIYKYSDMNGFGHFLLPVSSYNAYWFSISGLLLISGNLLWVRGIEAGFKDRIKIVIARFNGKIKIGLSISLLLSLVSGAWIYYNTAILNKYLTSEEAQQKQVLYEKKYKKLQFAAQPKIADLKLYADLIPENRQAKLKGVFKIWNDTDKSIDTLYLTMSPNTEIKALKINDIALQLLTDDKETDFKIFKLPKTLSPKDSANLELSLDFAYKGFVNDGHNANLVHNGIFFDMNIFPYMGYNQNLELNSDQERKKNGLPNKKYGLPNIDDKHYKNVNFVTPASDYLTFEAIISTAPDQIAVVPGYLQREWTENGRKYYHYSMGNAKDVLFFSIVSARYAVLRDKWVSKEGKSVDIEIFHHPTHTKNLTHFVESVKASLAYYSDNFSPYQHKQMRILEYPRYQNFAQSFANTIPYAEGVGFIADFSNPDDTNYAYSLTAHEVAHQWWGHQVMPAATIGNGFVSETMAEYSSLMVLKQRYGAAQMPKFLKYKVDGYLWGRGSEAKQEPPLLYADGGHNYLYYDKGSVVMYALADYIGEEALNKQLKKYVDTVAFTSKPYANSLDLYQYIKAAVPDSLKYLAEDMFEKVTLYENKTEETSYKKISETEYLVTLTIKTKKSYADEKGNEIETETQRDLIEIGIFADETKDKNGLKYNKPLYLQKLWLTKGQHKLTFTVKEKPYKAGIDPYNKLIDRVGSDNVKVVGEE